MFGRGRGRLIKSVAVTARVCIVRACRLDNGFLAFLSSLSLSLPDTPCIEWKRRRRGRAVSKLSTRVDCRSDARRLQRGKTHHSLPPSLTAHKDRVRPTKKSYDTAHHECFIPCPLTTADTLVAPIARAHMQSALFCSGVPSFTMLRIVQ